MGKQVYKQICWINRTTSITIGERWEAQLDIDIYEVGDTGDRERKQAVGLVLGYLQVTPVKTYRYEVKIAHPVIRGPLQTRLKGCFFETPEDGKKALEDIISTIDISSLNH